MKKLIMMAATLIMCFASWLWQPSPPGGGCGGVANSDVGWGHRDWVGGLDKMEPGCRTTTTAWTCMNMFHSTQKKLVMGKPRYISLVCVCVAHCAGSMAVADSKDNEKTEMECSVSDGQVSLHINIRKENEWDEIDMPHSPYLQ